MTDTILAPKVKLAAALIVDDHPLFCEALSLTLRSVVDVDAIQTADRLDAALALLEGDFKPEAVLLDLSLPDVQGLDGLIRLKRKLGAVPVIVVSSLADPRIIASAVQAGASGFVPKHSQRDVFRRAFDEIWQGQVFLPDGNIPLAGAAEAASTDDELLRRLSDLTVQQSKILQLVCQGKLNKQIAYELGIAETTVKAHITAILRKLGVQSRTQAVLMAQNARFEKILYDAAGLD